MTLYVVCLLASLIVIFSWARRALRLSKSAVDWAAVTGVVRLADLEIRGRFANISGKQLTYYYEVNGQRFSGHRVYPAISTSSLAYVVRFNDRAFVDQNFVDGQRIRVLYNPSRPAQSCLVPGGRELVLKEAAYWVVLAVFLFVVMPGIYYFLTGRF